MLVFHCLHDAVMCLLMGGLEAISQHSYIYSIPQCTYHVMVLMTRVNSTPECQLSGVIMWLIYAHSIKPEFLRIYNVNIRYLFVTLQSTLLYSKSSSM